ncbi:MAG: TRAP transporter substrate-binding protein [Spirochaetaceae bacterium]|nr:TRAP transporter substrate-binding protein [Spirochaetaceae bacterium]MDT8296664.1 TRAP transporter substrate-binding protein [Spirochaetaceae bacterium]
MKKFLLLVVVLLISGTMLFAEGQADSGEENFTITAGIGLNDKSAQYESLVLFKDIVEKNSDGRITVELYHSSQLGDDREMMEALQRGEQEMTCPSTAPIAPFVPEFGIFDLPFLFPTAEDADYVLDSEIGQNLLDELSDIGIKGLVYWENGYRNLTNSVRAVRTPADVKGMKVRTMENPMHLDAWRAMGANPTPMAFGELFSAMQQGVVDGQENPWGTIYLQNFPEVQGFATDTGHVYSPFVLMIAQSFWDGLPADLQDIVMDAAVQSRDHNRELNRRYNAEYMEKLKDVMTVVELTADQKAQFQSAVMPVYDKYADVIGQDLIDAVIKKIAER